MPNAGQTMPNVSVVRSEPLSARMDPEDLRELITTYQAYALKACGRFMQPVPCLASRASATLWCEENCGGTRAADRGVAWEAWA